MQNIGEKINSQTGQKITSFGFVGHVEHPLELMPLMQLLLRSFLNNEKSGLTGAFFYDGVHIGEILEGPEKAVDNRWQTIRDDKAFKQLKIIGRKTIFNRCYSAWTMHAKDGAVIRLLYPELIRIVDEFSTTQSVFESIALAFEADVSARTRVPRVSYLRHTLN